MRETLAEWPPTYRYDAESIQRAVADPVWDLLDRGGKRWRPVVFLTLVEAFGEDPEAYLPYAAIPEILHTGTILVDDIEDRAAMRRGEPAGETKVFSTGHPLARSMTTDEANASVSRRGFLKAGAGATAAVGATGTAAAQEGNESEGGGGGGGMETVALTGDNVFDPEELYIAPGTTVTFDWASDGHNVIVDSKPDDSDWEGHEPIENEGFSTEHTFEVLGDYEYYCSPHQSLGMEAVIHVTEGGENPNAGGGGGGPTLPDSALTMGVATMAALVSTLALAFFFLKYGGDYEMPE